MMDMKKIAMWALLEVIVLNAGYGAYIAVQYVSEVPLLVLFAAIALLGAIVALRGAHRAHSMMVAVGAMAQCAAPTGFAWLISCAITLIGAAMLVAIFLKRWRPTYGAS